jgi:OOP family OmpA-OmpF porin
VTTDMTFSTTSTLVLTLSLAVALSACKPKPGEPTAEQKAAAAAAAAGQPAPAATPAPAPAAAPAPVPAVVADVSALAKIAVLTKPLPPFPFIPFPSSLKENDQHVEDAAFDQVSVVVGDKLHTVEGRVRESLFYLDDAKLSAFQAKRDYTKAALDLGGVKVNTLEPADDAFHAANGGDDQVSEVRKKLRFESGLSYDVYYLPTATGRQWIVLMFGPSKVNMLAIEEKTQESSLKPLTAN